MWLLHPRRTFLGMTKGSKGVFWGSLTTPSTYHPRKLLFAGPDTSTPLRRGELCPATVCSWFSSAEGWARPGVGYSMAQAWSNTYEPVLSLHLVTACAGGIILFRPGICPCWWQFPIADHRVIHRRRMFVNLECLDRLLHRPLRKSRPDLPFHICNH